MDISIFLEDNLKNCKLESLISEKLRSEPCCLGIDEAGRGPVLGPMVYAACFSPLCDKESLGKMGFTDSKVLTEAQREKLFEKIHESSDFIGWMIEIISPTTISTSMSKRCKYNLNLLSHDAAIGLIQRALDAQVNVTEVYVDTVGDATKYQNKLSDIFPNLKITVAKKADSTYTIVSAASICAKVARDRAVKSWNFSEGLELSDSDYGSGYPNDPETKTFLKNNLDKIFGFPQFVRFSWSTAEKIIDENAVEVQWEDDDDESPAKDTPSVLSFFKREKNNNIKKRHSFLTDIGLNQVIEM